jgi:hypothetical protein
VIELRDGNSLPRGAGQDIYLYANDGKYLYKRTTDAQSKIQLRLPSGSYKVKHWGTSAWNWSNSFFAESSLAFDSE